MNITEKYREMLIGKKFQTTNCGICEVIDYKSSKQVTVKFYEPEYVTTCFLHQLRKGHVSNPFVPSRYNKGYLGEGEYSFKDKRVYGVWVNSLKRCYCNNTRYKFPTYVEAEVCEEWLNFQNFAKWCYEQQSFQLKDEKGRWYHLDKDILVKGNKIYSPETCCFVPQEINALLTLNDINRGEYPLGVSYIKNTGRFQVNLSSNKNSYLGVFDTPEEAFIVYKKAKEDYIKEVAEKWKGEIDERAYQALLNYEVEIDD